MSNSLMRLHQAISQPAEQHTRASCSSGMQKLSSGTSLAAVLQLLKRSRSEGVQLSSQQQLASQLLVVKSQGQRPAGTSGLALPVSSVVVWPRHCFASASARAHVVTEVLYITIERWARTDLGENLREPEDVYSASTFRSDYRCDRQDRRFTLQQLASSQREARVSSGTWAFSDDY